MIGAGHVGYHLAKLAHTIGFKIHVLDDREKFASRERFPDAAEVTVDSIPDWLHKAVIPSNAYVVIVTRGHTHDLDALRVARGARPALSRPDRQQSQGEAHLRRAACRRHAAGISPARARAGRPRHRRLSPEEIAVVDPRGADRRSPRQDPRSPRRRGVDALGQAAVPPSSPDPCIIALALSMTDC